MKPERERLICFLAGFYMGQNLNNIEGLAQKIEQHLINSNQPPLDKEDSEVFNELLAEQIYSVFTKHGYINRATKRKYDIK